MTDISQSERKSPSEATSTKVVKTHVIDNSPYSQHFTHTHTHTHTHIKSFSKSNNDPVLEPTNYVISNCVCQEGFWHRWQGDHDVPCYITINNSY